MINIFKRFPSNCKKRLGGVEAEGQRGEQPSFLEMAAKDRMILAPWGVPSPPKKARGCLVLVFTGPDGRGGVDMVPGASSDNFLGQTWLEGHVLLEPRITVAFEAWPRALRRSQHPCEGAG